jgi:lysophospholipase L1-like esterase
LNICQKLKSPLLVVGIFLGCLVSGELVLQVGYFLLKGYTTYQSQQLAAEGKTFFVMDPDLGYRSAAHLKVKRPPPDGLPTAPRRRMFYDVETDSHGFRYDQSLASPKPKGEIRIFCLGGSTTFGAEVPNKYTYPQQLNDLLNDKDVKVINAGVGGYRSIHLLRYYEKVIRPLEPDVITIYCGWNDYEDFLFSYWKPGDPHGHCLIVQLADVTSPLGYLVTGKLILRAYYKIMNFNRTEAAKDDYRAKYSQEADNPVWQEEHRKNLQALIEAAVADKCLPVFVVFPSPEFAGATQEVKDFADLDLNMAGRWDGFVTALKAIRRNLHHLAEKNGKPLIDANAPFESLNGDYRAKFQLFVDRMHLTKEGNALIAKAMYPEIKGVVEKIRANQRLGDGAGANTRSLTGTE